MSAAAAEVELRDAVERALAHESPAPKVARLTRRPSAYRTSFALEEVDVVFDTGDRRELLFKDLSREGLHEAARGAKPAFLYDPAREVTVYQTILPRAPSGTARCYAAVADERRGHYWLLLERVPGVELYQVGSLAAWQAVARWLAQFHHCFRPTGWSPDTASHLIPRDDAYHRRWLDRARSYSRPDDTERNAALSRLGARLDAVLATAARSSQGLIHGEFYASNVLIDAQPSPSRVCPVDWEMAGTGPVLLDLAALTCGWDETGRMAIAQAYHDEAGGAETMSAEAFLEALASCEVLVALQWLGWSATWSPPADHRRDWVALLNRRLAATQ